MYGGALWMPPVAVQLFPRTHLLGLFNVSRVYRHSLDFLAIIIRDSRNDIKPAYHKSFTVLTVYLHWQRENRWSSSVFSDALAIINDDYQRGNSKQKECQNVGDDGGSSAKQLSRFFGGPGVTHGVARRELFALLSVLGADVFRQMNFCSSLHQRADTLAAINTPPGNLKCEISPTGTSITTWNARRNIP